jgi:response regulator NasT
MSIDASIKIAVVEDNPTRCLVVDEGLREAGYSNIVHIKEKIGLLNILNQIAPDVILIDLGNPNRDVLDQVLHISRIVPLPVVMFVDQSDVETIRSAVEAGVSAYIVDGLKKERVTSILQIAILRYRAFAAMKGEIASLKAQLDERKVIERAKGIIMEAKGISEAEAYQLMKRQAMSSNRRLFDIANAIVVAMELLK